MLIIRRPLQKEFASNNSLNTLNDIARLQNPGLSKELLKILIMSTDGEDIYHWLSDIVINKYIKENISAENRNRFFNSSWYIIYKSGR